MDAMVLPDLTVKTAERLSRIDSEPASEIRIEINAESDRDAASSAREPICEADPGVSSELPNSSDPCHSKVGADDWIKIAIQRRLATNRRDAGLEPSDATRGWVAAEFRNTILALALLGQPITDDFLARLYSNVCQASVAFLNGKFMLYHGTTGTWGEDQAKAIVRTPARLAPLLVDSVSLLQRLAALEKQAKQPGIKKQGVVPNELDSFIERIDALNKKACYLASANGAENVLKFARSLVVIPHRRWDAHDSLFCTENAVIDLRTSNTVDPSPSLLLTKFSPIRYEPLALCPKWSDFVKEILPDPDVRRHLQAAIG
jgi:hypothetical protein